jgi:hypothetical protein
MFKTSPQFALYDTIVKRIERPNGDRTGYFKISIDVKPYFGPHLHVGEDNISIELSAFNEPKILKFEHLKSIKLTEHYNNYYLNN